MMLKVLRVKFAIVALLGLFVIPQFGPTLLAQGRIIPQPQHSRPYFMPRSNIEEIINLISRESWAKSEYERINKAVREVNSRLGEIKFIESEEAQKTAFWAAFLYALEGNPVNLNVAREWLMQAYNHNSRETILATQALDDPEYWKGNSKIIPWQRLDFDAYIAYDWIFKGLSIEDRSYLYRSLSQQTRFLMACMDTWSYSAGQDFKTISMIAFAGMALFDKGIMEWAWTREKGQGNFYSMMDKMFKDGAVWSEGPVNALENSVLHCVTTIAFYRSMYERRNWFDHETPGGASARKIVEYFINTSYPLENTGVGNGRIRVATYGNGTSGPHSCRGEHDLFIGGIQPDSRSSLYSCMKEGLAMGYACTKDPAIAPFLALYTDYKPNLWDRPPLPEMLNWPNAHSAIWPESGIAMLRSDETQGYFTNQDAIAVFQLMTKSHGQEQPDKFHISLYGAGRLIYPYHSGLGFDGRSPGLTVTSASHNTMIVDENDAEPTEAYIRSDFTPEVKFLSTSASGVFADVDQTRCLMLTNDYLLDLFHAGSDTPRTYDYLLHITGLPSPVDPSKYKKEKNIPIKYLSLDSPVKAIIPGQWSIDFNLEERLPKKPVPGLGSEWFDHVARCRVTMAAEDNTQIYYGTLGHSINTKKAIKTATIDVPGRSTKTRLAKQISKTPEPTGMLIVRRPECHSTVFAVTHEPYSNDQKPLITAISKVAQTDAGLVVRVRGENFTDYAAIAWGKDAYKDVYLLTGEDVKEVFRFKNYAWLRVPDEGVATARGEWLGFRIPGNTGEFIMNDQLKKLNQSEGYVVFGNIQ